MSGQDVREVRDALERLIAEYDERLGYLGADWEREVRERFESGGDISFSVYFDDLTMECFVVLDAGEWTPDTYLDMVARRALEHAAGDDRISDPIPDGFEQAF